MDNEKDAEQVEREGASSSAPHVDLALSRREFLCVGLASSAVLGLSRKGFANPSQKDKESNSQVFRVDNCPPHDEKDRHVGVDALLALLAAQGIKLYQTHQPGQLCGERGLVARNDVVVLKVNAQWKCRGGTNTDMLRGLIHRILQHPDGFSGEVVIFENGQNRPAAFDGIHNDGLKSEYLPFPELAGVVMVNAEQQNVTTIDYLARKVFAGKPVSSFLMDPYARTFIARDEHVANGYRRIGEAGTPCISYPCFTTAHGNRIELREGRWTGLKYDSNVKLIHCAVLKDHSGDIGMTGALKLVYGTLSMSDGSSARRHYQDLGSQCARMWSEVRPADLNILDCLWVSHGAKSVNGVPVSGCIGYPPELTTRQNVLLAGVDPLALDCYASRHILVPLGGPNVERHDVDRNERLESVYLQAKETINAAGGIRGKSVHTEEERIDLLRISAKDRTSG